MEEYPIYDESFLPKLILPLNVTLNNGNRYLGGRVLNDYIKATVPYIAETNEKLNNLYSFWKDTLDYGSKMFIIKADILGLREEGSYELLFTWDKGFNGNKNGGEITRGSLNLTLKYKLDLNNNELIEI